ncbi:MAG TPA: protein kinase [Isosphaeraceae bacterium]|jgi:serine/threonine-protein kinase|nr:protein kinase [Isosphaeraceae bacterium]
MAAVPESVDLSGTVAWALREPIIREFDRAWRVGLRPAIEGYLPRADPAERRSVLIELVHTELEYRVKDGEPARAEDYLRRFPELAGDRETERELIEAELELRRRRDPGLDLDDYLARFPAHHEALLALRGRLATADRPASAAPARPAAAARALGKYELLEEVGRGTAGVVYRARDAELDRVVALKVPRADRLESAEDVAPFLREARSAAQLHHPNIVRLLDFGRADGSCFLAYEFVAGTTLARRLATGRIPFRQAAALAGQIAGALGHAHRMGVIHRDLKPANVLIDAEGRPCLADFGLARRQEGEVTVTPDGAALGTPAYMPPEQVRGESHRVDGRADLFSLGVMLYEMLAGERPFRGDTRPALYRQILEDEPYPPRRRNDRIPRDLETICLKCLEKEPAGRYATADDLAEDLRRFLAAEPILARPIGPVERFARRCRRHPLATGLIAALALAILGGLAGVTWQWRRADREWGRAESNLEQARLQGARAEENADEIGRVVDDLFTRVSEDTLLNVPGMQPLRRGLLAAALRRYERLLGQRAESFALRAELAMAQRRVGFIDAALGQRPEALVAYRDALARYRQLLRERPGDPKLRHHAAGALVELAHIQQDSGRPGEATASYAEARAMLEDLARERPGAADVRHDLAVLDVDVARRSSLDGRPAEALALLRRARDHLEGVIASRPRDARARAELARCLVTAAPLHERSGRRGEAAAALERARELLAQLAEEQPGVQEHRAHLAGVDFNLAWYLPARDPRTERHLREALDLQERLAAANPAIPAFGLDLGRTCGLLGLLDLNLGRNAEAVPLLERARDLKARHARESPRDPKAWDEAGENLYNLGLAEAALRRHDRAAAAYRQAGEAYARAFELAPTDPSYRDRRGNMLIRLFGSLHAQRRPAEAAAAIREFATLRPGDPAARYRAACGIAFCIPLVGDGRDPPAEAERRRYADEAVATLADAVALGFRDVRSLRRDPALNPLRARGDFRALVLDVSFPRDPFRR